jgi:S1-C subfamily serine protease
MKPSATCGSGVDQGSGVGFAIPIDPVKAELSTLESGHTVTLTLTRQSKAVKLTATLADEPNRPQAG